jgi:beta-phosphoglucomutase-like phosphatase (HAD superfamily)
MAATTRRDQRGHHAFVFDMDGVVTDTAKVDAEAWKALFGVASRKLPTHPAYNCTIAVSCNNLIV